jgi:hypothetical protein
LLLELDDAIAVGPREGHVLHHDAGDGPFRLEEGEAEEGSRQSLQVGRAHVDPDRSAGTELADPVLNQGLELLQ